MRFTLKHAPASLALALAVTSLVASGAAGAQSPGIAPHPAANGARWVLATIDAPHVRGIVVIHDAATSSPSSLAPALSLNFAQMVISLGGLKPGATYRVVGNRALCSQAPQASDRVVARTFVPDDNGAAYLS